MMNFFTTDMKKEQEKMIRYFLNEEKEKGNIEDDIEYEQLFKAYLSQIELGKPLMKIRPQNGQILSEPINETFKEIFIDFLTLFNEINKIDETSNRYNQLSQSLFSQLNSEIESIKNTLKKYEEILMYKNVQDVFIESFYYYEDTVNEDVYKDGEGNQIAKACRVNYNQEGNFIELPLVFQENGLIQENGLQLAKIYIGKQFGSGLVRISNPETSIEKLMDTTKETFWSESILVDEPIELEMTEIKDINTGERWYYVQQGAVCEVIVEYDYPTIINEISITPFCEFPLEVVAIKYTETINGEEVEHFLVHENGENGLISKESKSNIRYQFQDTMIEKLIIILNQKHYIKTEYIVPEKSKIQLLAWLNGVSKKKNNFNIMKPIYENKKESDPMFIQFLESTKETDKSLNEIFEYDKKTVNTKIEKYEYQYGIYELKTNKNEYKDVGIYVSPWISAKGEVKSIRLFTKEELPFVNINKENVCICDIEYYISYKKEAKNKNDWYPILPINKKEILAEKLHVYKENGTYKAKTRFKIKHVISIKENGIPLSESDYIILDDFIFMKKYNQHAVYTIHYETKEDAYVIDFEKTLEETKINRNEKEIIYTNKIEFKGTNDYGYIELNHQPYVDREMVYLEYDKNENWNPSFLSQNYTPIKVELIDEQGYKIQQPMYESDLEDKNHIWLLNKTNYLDPMFQDMDVFDKQLLNYQYTVVGNKIQFNTKIPKTTKIIVEYPYYASGFYVKAILRRNAKNYVGFSPVLHDYRLYIEVNENE
ncbi:MAG: hypothetical protein N2043_02060 [Ignavibacterium sp.]|nr:hypothetical protein [Ignavibacterium sp.]